jgi:stage III sporulation protein AG
MDNKVIYVNNSDSGEMTKDEGFKYRLIKFLTKKNLKIIALIIIGIVGVIIFMGSGSSKKTKDTSSVVQSVSGYMTTLEYCGQLESKLTSVLSSIDGAGKVSVMVSVDGSPELVYATDDTKTSTSNSSGTSSSSNTSSPIIVDVGEYNSALILTENLPAVKGVIVVSSGAGDVAVKLNITRAVSTLLGISVDQVSVLKGI